MRAADACECARLCASACVCVRTRLAYDNAHENERAPTTTTAAASAHHITARSKRESMSLTCIVHRKRERESGQQPHTLPLHSSVHSHAVHLHMHMCAHTKRVLAQRERERARTWERARARQRECAIIFYCCWALWDDDADDDDCVTLCRQSALLVPVLRCSLHSVKPITRSKIGRSSAILFFYPKLFFVFHFLL